MESSPLVRIAIVVAFLMVLASLGVALVRLVRNRGHTTGTVKALTWRIGLSLTLFALLVVGMLTGVVVPHGVIP
jgi:hypothetical protein